MNFHCTTFTGQKPMFHSNSKSHMSVVDLVSWALQSLQYLLHTLELNEHCGYL